MADKKYKEHMMYGDGKARKAETNAEHLELKEKGWGHKKPSGFKMKGYTYPGQSPMTFKGANSKNSGCWDGYRKVGTKPSPSGTGETVNDCEKIK